jgi:hypothetical protein
VAEKSELRIEVFFKRPGLFGGNVYGARLIAEAPGQPPWERGVYIADSPVGAVKRVLSDIEDLASRSGPGRRPRGYRVACHLAEGK